LLFPIFIVRGEAINSNDIEMIRARLKVIVERRGFQDVLRACEVLEEVWGKRAKAAKDDEYRVLDWQGVLKKQGGGALADLSVAKTS
jgi:hypothetical protein